MTNGSGRRLEPGPTLAVMLASLRRYVSGAIMMFVGLWLALSASSNGGTGLILGVVFLVVWGGSGLGILAGKRWGRPLGLITSLVGLALGVSLATAGVNSPLAGVVFSWPDSARWYVVMPIGYALGFVSVLEAVLLVIPFRQGSPTP